MSSSDCNEWIVTPSRISMRVRNKIREIVDQLPLNELRRDIEFISLGIGDPTKYPNLLPSKNVTESVKNALLSHKYNGYEASFGSDEARTAVAKRFSYSNICVTKDDVYLCSGCSDGIQMSITALLNPNDNILLPEPGFSLYELVCNRNDFEARYYKCNPNKNWEVDLKSLESLIDNRTRCILINSPSNPCGSILSKNNLYGILSIAKKYRLPIISDEIYDGMSYYNNYYPIASLLNNNTYNVPIITLGGLAKQYLVPGWRIGWIIIYDKLNALRNVRKAILKLTTVIVGCNTIIQGALNSILFNTPKSYFTNLNKTLKHQSELFYKIYSDIPGLTPIKSQGAMYMLTYINNKMLGFNDDIHFSKTLLLEENVLVLPGVIFGAPNYFRTVVCPPPNIIYEVGKRMKRFCIKYITKNKNEYNKKSKL